MTGVRVLLVDDQAPLLRAMSAAVEETQVLSSWVRPPAGRTPPSPRLSFSPTSCWSERQVAARGPSCAASDTSALWHQGAN
jgi:hypothetical protein